MASPQQVQVQVTGTLSCVNKKILSAVLICEDADTGRRAGEFCDRLFDEIGDGCLVRKNKWDFERLCNRKIRNLAASAAATADLVIFSVSGKGNLPDAIKEWIEMWDWLIDGHYPALVALFDEDSDAINAPSIRAYLHAVAALKRIDYFHHPANLPLHDWLEWASASGHANPGNPIGTIRGKLSRWRKGVPTGSQFSTGGYHE